MSAEELAAMDAKIVADTIAEMQRQIEQLTGARHSMYDPAVAIARDIANRTPPAMSADHIGDAGPAPIKPSGDIGELRERVARRVCRIVRTWQEFKATPEYTLDMEVENAWDDWLSEADAILDLIQSERVHR